MRYMFLVYSREVDLARVPAEEIDDIRRRHRAIQEEARQKGILYGAEPLQPTSTATTVRTDAGRPLITDGPFAETKEQLAGYYILECRDLDEAIEWAAKIPTACRGGSGCIEIRPFMARAPG